MDRRLVERAFRPARPDLAAARAATSGIREPRAAWEALYARGLIPASWLHEPRRRFPSLPGLRADERAEQLRRAPFIARGEAPDDLAACSLLASDIAGVERAEACGLQMLLTLRPWGAPPAGAVLWVPTSVSHYNYQLHDTKPGVWEPDAAIWSVIRDARWDDVCNLMERLGSEVNRDPASITRQAVEAVGVWLYGHQLWTARVRAGERVPRSAPEEVAGRPYADLANPFEAALALFETGYAPLPSGDQLLVLGYPV